MKKIKGNEYRFTKLSTFQQFDIARKMAPVLAILALQKNEQTLERGFATSFCALTEGVSKEDMDIVLAMCLSGVTRQVSQDQWVNVYVNGTFAYLDIDLDVMLLLVWNVLKENNLVNFFSEPLSASAGAREKKPGSSGSPSQKVAAG